MTLGFDAASSNDTPNLFAPRRSRVFVGDVAGFSRARSRPFSSLLLLSRCSSSRRAGRAVRHVFFDPHYMWVAWMGDPGKGHPRHPRRHRYQNLDVSTKRSAGLALRVGTRLDPHESLTRLAAVSYSRYRLHGRLSWYSLILVVFLVGLRTGRVSRFGFLSNQSPAVYVRDCAHAYLHRVTSLMKCFESGNSLGAQRATARRAFTRPHATLSTMRRVTLPQAVRTVYPSAPQRLSSRSKKTTALVSVLGAVEATRAAQIAVVRGTSTKADSPSAAHSSLQS